MKTISIEDDVLSALEDQVVGFNDTPSSVIRRLLEKSGKLAARTGAISATSAKTGASTNGKHAHPFSDLLKSPAYVTASAGQKYFQVLAALYRLQGEAEFSKINNYEFEGRIYIANNVEAIEIGSNSTNPRPIPGTNFFARSTLTNAAKRKILSDVLLLFYPPSIIGQVLATMPDPADAPGSLPASKSKSGSATQCEISERPRSEKPSAGLRYSLFKRTGDLK
jgi:negative modulator of initiation of replication